MTFADARAKAEAWAQAHVLARPDDQLVLVWDPAARLRLVASLKLEPGETKATEQASLAAQLQTELGAFFSGDVILRDGQAKPVFDAAWNTAAELNPVSAGVRVLERRRSKDDWFEAADAPWELGDGPPIVTFASYKGGFGRSTALAATAVGLAASGLRVLVVDLDLEAPGVLTLLPPSGLTDDSSGAVVGLVDVLLDKEALADAVYPAAVDPGIEVLPAGTVDASYLEKLSRLDYEALVDPSGGEGGPLHRILRVVRDRDYDIILLDARAGLHDLTGAAINGTPHLVVLFGRDTEESWAGIELILRQIGERRVTSLQGQQDLVLAFGKAPGGADTDQTFTDAVRRFRERAYDVFADAYYAESDVDADVLIPLPAQGDDEAQHVPIGLRFSAEVLHGDGRQVPGDELGYGRLRKRILRRVGIEIA